MGDMLVAHEDDVPKNRGLRVWPLRAGYWVRVAQYFCNILYSVSEKYLIGTAKKTK